MRVPLMSVDMIPESGAVMTELFGKQVLIYLTRGQPQALVNLCNPTEEAPADSLGSDAQLVMLPTLVENGMLTYVSGD